MQDSILRGCQAGSQIVSLKFSFVVKMFDVILVILTFVWAYFLWSRRKYYAFAWKMPGEWGWPLIGIAHKINKPEDALYLFPRLWLERKAKSLFLWMGPHPFIFTTDPELAGKVLNSSDCINKSIFYDAIEEVLPGGILTLKSPVWNTHRKLLNPCFGNSVVMSFIPLFNQLARDLCDKLDRNVNCGGVDVRDFLLGTTLRSSLATTMGTMDGDESIKLFKEHFTNIVSIVAKKTFAPWLRVQLLFQATSMFKVLSEALNAIKTSVDELALNKIQASAQDRKIVGENFEGSTDIKKASNIFIDKAVKLYQENVFTLDEVTSEANILVIGAFETTTTTMHSLLMFLAMHPQYQEKAYDEIRTLFPDENHEYSREDLKDLVYLNMCINETLRVAPSIPFIARKATSDVKISDDLVIPRGMDIVIDIFNMHRDKDVWGPTASNFDPDHHLPENLVNKHKHAFIPFSIGSRNCIGRQYAGLFMKIILSKVLRKYRFSTNMRFEDLHYVNNIMLAYKTVPFLEVHRR